jgi:dTDP-4-dehydrorhamnose reductase
MKLLVFGAQGQVARALAEAPGSFDVERVGHDRLDLSGPSPDIAGLIASARPAAVINAAAYNAVDQAEREIEVARRVNRDAPAAMATACAAGDIPFVHISTDYVFDGEKGAPYVKGDAVGPVNAYGRSKAEGEAALAPLIAGGARLAVMRTAWVFAPSGGGFFGTMLRLAAERDEVAVVADQTSTPTPASACADAALTLARALLDRDGRASGLFHAAGRDGMSRADMAEALFGQLAARGGRRPRVRRVNSADFAQAARRPRDSRLDSRHLETVTGWRAPAFDDALGLTLDRSRSLAR